MRQADPDVTAGRGVFLSRLGRRWRAERDTTEPQLTRVALAGLRLVIGEPL